MLYLSKTALRSSTLMLLFLLIANLKVAANDNDAKLPQPVVPFVVHSFYNADFPVEEQLGGYLGARYYANLEKRLLEIDEKEMLAGFLKRPGKQEWIGEHVGKYLETAANTWTVTKDKRLRAQMDRIAATLMSTQLPDGYLGTYLPADYWTAWDVWVHKYDIYGLLAYYRISGDPKALETCKKVGDLLCRTFGNGPGQAGYCIIRRARWDGGHKCAGSYGRIVPVDSDKKYLDFCYYIIGAYDQSNGPKIIKTLLKDKQVNKVANGKAYEMLFKPGGYRKAVPANRRKRHAEKRRDRV